MEDKKTIKEVVLKGDELQGIMNFIMDLPTRMGNPLLGAILRNAFYDEPSPEETHVEKTSKPVRRK